MKRLLCIITLMLALVCALASCGDGEPTVSVNDDGYVVVNGVATEIVADKDDVITVDTDGYVIVNGTKTEYKIHTTDEISVNEDGFVVVNGTKTEYKIHTADEISVNADGHVVVNGVTTEIVADKDDVITVDADGYIVVNGVKTEHKSQAETDAENPQGFIFTLKPDGTYSISAGRAKNDKIIEIPSSYKDIPVTEVAPAGFAFCPNLVCLTIPDSITNIGLFGFVGCANLKSVTNEANLPNLREDFGDNHIVEFVNNSSEEISFYGNALMEVHSGDSKIKFIDDFLFYEKNGVFYLVGYAGNDTELVLPESFNGNEYIIGDYAFAAFSSDNGCTSSIKSVTISNGITSIGENAFSHCTNLQSIEIAKSVQSIGSYAFWGCKSLTNIQIPENVTIIEDGVFSDCKYLQTITFLGTVTDIKTSAFVNCSSITDIYYAGSEEQWNLIEIHSYNGYLLKGTVHYNYTREE